MQFINLHAADLKGRVDLPGFEEWLAGWGEEDRTGLILAPAGSGKAAAVGALANRLRKPVVQCNLLELLEYEDRARQLKTLLLACQTHKGAVVQLDKVSQAAERWGEDAGQDLGPSLAAWLRQVRPQLAESDSVVILSGRQPDALGKALLEAVDRKLIV